MIKNVLLDLDGTLIDSAEGILSSVEYAFEKLGMAVPPRNELMRFIGPPLDVSFRTFYGMDEETSARAVALYRENYRPRGVYQFKVYDGVETMLKKITKSARRVYLATSKPEVFARQILEKAGLIHYFTAICGSLIPSGRDSKEEVIAYLLENEKLALEQTVMVGDRAYDVIGANACGVTPIGVTYGYGSAKELHKAGAEILAGSPRELCTIVMTV